MSEARETLLRTLIEGASAEPLASLPAPSWVEPAVHELILAFLHWETTPENAAGAASKLYGSVIDVNELRVCLPGEVSRVIGEGYPRSFERAHRLLSVLGDLFERENAVTLTPASELSKRKTREYLASLEGITPFVVARVMLSLGGHAVPLDRRLMDRLTAAGVLEGGEDIESASAWLERQIRASETPGAYFALERWASSQPEPPQAAHGAEGPEPAVPGKRRKNGAGPETSAGKAPSRRKK